MDDRPHNPVRDAPVLCLCPDRLQFVTYNEVNPSYTEFLVLPGEQMN